MRFIQFIRPEHLTPDMQLVAEICGIDTVRTLIQELPGTRLYIPHSSRMFPAIHEYILLRHGEGILDHLIARELNCSLHYVREHIRNAGSS